MGCADQTRSHNVESLSYRPAPAKRLAQRDAAILNRMMRIHFQVPSAPQAQVHDRMLRKQRQHVSKKAMPVLIDALQCPSISSRTSIFVSFVLRLITARRNLIRRIKPNQLRPQRANSGRTAVAKIILRLWLQLGWIRAAGKPKKGVKSAAGCSSAEGPS